jgi:sensor histidine kinase YesM
MKYCQECQTEYPDDKNFCKDCGKQLAKMTMAAAESEETNKTEVGNLKKPLTQNHVSGMMFSGRSYTWIFLLVIWAITLAVSISMVMEFLDLIDWLMTVMPLVALGFILKLLFQKERDKQSERLYLVISIIFILFFSIAVFPDI